MKSDRIVLYLNQEVYSNLMKALLFQNPKTQESSFLVQEDKLDYFYDTLHYHPELQLTLILEGTGTQFIGENISNFQAGDVILLGENLPHVFKCDPTYYAGSPDLKAHSISIYFSCESFGAGFFALPELISVRKLMEEASRGIRIIGDTRKEIMSHIKEMIHLKGLDRLLKLLTILERISTSKELSYISSVSFSTPFKEADNKRINAIFDYVMKNFSQEISLDEVASIANMSATAFCRYFKRRTRKTFSHFLNEIRIGNACRLLIGDSLNISEIAYESGFNNIAYFNRKFKEITQMTPSEYVTRFKNV